MTTGLAEDAIVGVHLGPTWDNDPAWQGPRDPAGYILPKFTLGWQILRWIRENLLDESSTDDKPVPFSPTNEQIRFILWWYAINEHGAFVYRDGVLQRLKGWGKDPLAAILAAVEFVGPCRFQGWTNAGIKAWDLEPGDPVAKSHPRAWIQIAAVSKDQTKNTMTIFPGLFSEACKKEHFIDLGKEVIYADHGQRRIEAVTSSPRSLEGGRATFVIRNETHHWLANNEGHEMAAVIERNATKSKDGAARALSITNAYEPSEDSVAQQQREAWENEHAGLAYDTGVLYDSLEAPAEAALRPPRKPSDPEPSEDEVRAYLASIIRAVRGDSTWLDVDRIVNSILDKKNPPSRSRRFWFNQVVAAEDAWVVPAAVDAAEDPLAMAAREGEVDQLRAGWLVLPSEPIAVFFDGSKSDDATGLVGCRISDGYIFTLGVWQKPTGDRGKGWVVPRGEVDSRVDEVFERFNPVAFWGDPSHTTDDEGVRYWDGLIDDWMRRFKDRLELWPTKTGHNAHAVMFDMTGPLRQQLFIAEAERFVTEMETKNDIEEYAPQIRHDGHPALKQHMKNARRNPNTKWGVSLMKEGRESALKIDLAVCAVGARMVRRLYLNRLEEEEPPVDNEVWAL